MSTFLDDAVQPHARPIHTADWLAARAAATPTRAALLTDHETLSYAQLDHRVNRVAGQLAACGVRRGARVAVLMQTGIDCAVIVHALARVRAVLVPLNSRLTPAELIWQLDKIRPALLLYDAACLEAAGAAGGALPTLAYTELTAADAAGQVPSARGRAANLDGVQAIVFTSGTSGTPKGVELTYANHFWSATASAYRLGVLPTDRWLSCLPLYHVGGLAVLFRSCLYGTAAVLHTRFDEAAFHHAIDHHQISLTSVVPTMLHRLLHTRRTPWPAALRLVILGGAAAPAALLQAAAEQNLPVATTYGMTEAASQIATQLPDAVAAKPGSVGKPLLFTGIHIVDNDGQRVPDGTIGTIVVSGPTVMRGYFEEPAATARVLTPPQDQDAFPALQTGDVGYLDQDGDLYVLQRRSDIIISGGENVYPAEVEAALEAHPQVARACVVGLEDVEWGQRVAALIEPVEGEAPGAEAIRDFLAARLAGYKRPRYLQMVDQLPQTASGKIERRAVRAMLEAEAIRKDE